MNNTIACCNNCTRICDFYFWRIFQNLIDRLSDDSDIPFNGTA